MSKWQHAMLWHTRLWCHATIFTRRGCVRVEGLEPHRIDVVSVAWRGAQTEASLQRVAAARRRADLEDALQPVLDVVLAVIGGASRRRGITGHNLVEGILVVGRLKANEAPDGCGGGEHAINGVGVLDSEPCGDHATVAPAEADHWRPPRLPLVAEAVKQGRKVSHRLLRREVAQAAGRARREEERLAVVAVLGKDQRSPERACRLPHQACVVNV